MNVSDISSIRLYPTEDFGGPATHMVPVGDPSIEAAYVRHDTLDVLAGGIIQDAVRAKDDNVYDRTSIRAWFEACKQSKVYAGKVVSPLTLKPMKEELLDDAELNSELKRRRDEIERGDVKIGEPVASPYKSIAMLSEVFERLDRLGAYLKEHIRAPGGEDITPPIVIALGNESSGKSSILERLTMIPLLPRGEDTCTVSQLPSASPPHDVTYNVPSPSVTSIPVALPAAHSNHAPLALLYKSGASSPTCDRLGHWYL